MTMISPLYNLLKLGVTTKKSSSVAPPAGRNICISANIPQTNIQVVLKCLCHISAPPEDEPFRF